jgi:hypothetical protein
VRSSLAEGELTPEGGARLTRLRGRVGEGGALLGPERALLAVESHTLALEGGLSLEEAYSTLVGGPGALGRYRVYSCLARAGYRLAEHDAERWREMPRRGRVERGDADIDTGLLKVLQGRVIRRAEGGVGERVGEVVERGVGRGEGAGGEDEVEVVEVVEAVETRSERKRRGSSSHDMESPKRARPDEAADRGETVKKEQEEEELGNIFINPFHEAESFESEDYNAPGESSIDHNAPEESSIEEVVLEDEEVMEEEVVVLETESCVPGGSVEEAARPEPGPADTMAHRVARAALTRLAAVPSKTGWPETRRKAAGAFDMTPPAHPELHCQLCSVSVSSAGVMVQHKAGKRHLRALTLLGIKERKGERPEEEGDVIVLPGPGHEREEAGAGPERELPPRQELLSALPDSAGKSLVLLDRPDRWSTVL